MKLTVSRVRDVAMLTLGCGGLVRELFVVPTPNMIRVWVSIGLLLGPAALLAWWSARMGTPPPSVEPPQPSASSSQSPGS